MSRSERGGEIETHPNIPSKHIDCTVSGERSQTYEETGPFNVPVSVLEGQGIPTRCQ